jgi:hypothetical protein
VVTLPFGKKPDSAAEKGRGIDTSPDSAAPGKPDEQHETDKKRLSVLRKIIERYRDLIETGETKTVPDLRNLIDPKNKAIMQIRERILGAFHPYIYEEHFEKAAGFAFEFMRDSIGNETLPVDFWLYPEDVLELGVADEMDKAIFLCSLLMALDNDTAKVVVETEGQRHAFVLVEFLGKFRLMDPVHNVDIIGSREEILKAHIEGHDYKVIYEFSNKGYEEW